jgi:hypothetical protein
LKEEIMKKLVVLLAVASLFVCGNVFAQCSEDPNEICIFFSEDCYTCNNCLSFVGGPAYAYVVLMNCTQAAGVSGFEFCLCNDDGSPFAPPVGSSIFVSGYTLPPGNINAATAPCFAVGLSVPLPWSPCMTMVTVNLLVFSPNPWCFGAEPMVPASIPGHMAYADGADPGLLLPMYPCTETSCFMACLNSGDCPPPVAVEDATWGGVKNMYR